MSESRPSYDDLALRCAAAEQALTEMEKKYRVITENSCDMITLHGVDGLYQYASPACRTLLGYEPEELVGRNPYDLIHPDDIPQVRKSHVAVLEGAPFTLEYRLRGKDGAYRWLETNNTFIADDDGKVTGLICVTRDIAGRRQVVEKLRESENTLSRAQQVAHVGSWAWHIPENRLEWSDEMYRIFGIDKANFTGFLPDVVASVIHPDDRATVEKANLSVVQTSEPASLGYRIIRQDGTLRSVWAEAGDLLLDDDGKPLLLTGIVQDITDRKRAEDALRESEYNYRLLFNNIHDSVFVHGFTEDGEPGPFLQVNDVACHRYGYSREELEHMRPQELDTPAGLASIPLAMEQLMLKGYAMWEGEHHAKDGHIIPVEISNTLLDYQGAKAILSTVRDITVWKQAEEHLREMTQRLLLATSSAKLGIWEWDISDNTLSWDDRMYELYGMDRNSFPSTFEAWQHGLLPDDLEMAVEATRAATAGERDYDTEFRVVHPDGTVKILKANALVLRDAQGLPLRMIGLNYDITEQKQAEEALRESEERYRSLFNGITEGFSLHEIICDAAGKPCDYRFLDISPSFELLTGLQRSAVVGRLQSEVVPAEDPKWVEMFGKVALTGEPCQFDNYSPVLGKHFEVYAYSPAPLQFAVLFMDITARKEAEEERDKLQAQLAQAQKMESVGRLAGGVAHDFNNMLGVIMGYTDLALQEINPTHPLYAHLSEIKKASERSADLTRQLLAFARRQTVAPKVLDLNDTVDGMQKMLRRLIGENINLAWRPGADLWPLNIDPSQIDQLLANLCVNARDAIDGVGNITVTTANAELDEEYCAVHTLAKPGQYVRLQVKDDGSGMDAQTIENIFEPFFTTKEIGQGTGLGLATVYGVVMQNNGSIEVESQPGAGTTFSIYLPRYITKATSSMPAEETQPAQRGQETVLLVEDEPAILNVVRRVLEQQGYKVISSDTPGEAIQLANEHHGEIHLLMSDVIMPEMNGRDLARRVQTLYPGIKCLFMSGYTADVIAHHGVLEEGVNFIQKPFMIQELAIKVREVLDKRG